MRDFSDDSSSAYKQPWSAYWPEIDYVSIDDEITRLGSFAFAYCSNLTDISIPAQATSIGYRTFYCSGIEYARFQGNSIKEISRGSFEGASFLKSIYLPSSVTFIDQSAFYGCASLTTVDIPSPDLTYIGDSAFYQCRKLNSITIASTKLAYIGANAFYQCNDLTDVYFGGTRAQWNRIKIEETGNQLLLYVATIHCADDPLPAPDMTLTNANNGKPTITWTAVDKAEQYEVYRSSDGINYSVIYQSSGLTYTDNSAAAGSTYYYKVRAKNANSTGHFCDAASIASLAAPAAPSLTLTTDRSGKPVLKWTSVKDATAYEVFRSTTGAAGSFSIVRRTSYLTWTDANTEMGKMYYYVVRAKNGSLCGKFSPAQSVKCPIVLSAPSMTLDLNKSTGKPVISWTSVPFATQYEIYRSATGADKSYRIIRRTALLNYTDTTAASGTTYYYVVRAMRSTGSGAIYSRFCKAQSTLPAVPTMTLQVDDTTGKPVISWSKTANASQYEIYRSTTGADKSYRIIRRTALLNYTDTTAVAGTTYYYVVRAINNSIKGAFCKAQSILFTAQDVIANGSCGDNVTWKLLGDGTMLIIGRGPMWNYDSPDYSSGRHTPWATAGLLSDINEVIIRPGISSIGDSAFDSCSNLTSITVPDSITSIGNSAFSRCNSLTSIAIPSSVTFIGDGTFSYCSELASITIPDNLTAISAEVFSDCYSLTSVTIPDSVTSIGNSAFSRCNSLTSIAIPSSVTFIGDGTFSYCSELASITIPDNLTAISAEVFSDCYSLTSVTIPDSVTSIGDSAFDSCSKLASITIPDSVTSIGDSAFKDCYNLISITIPNSVTYIGDYAFDSCRSLTNITIPNSVTSIRDYTFDSCSSLTNITIPDSVTYIGNGAFNLCYNLISITIPNSVTYIGDYAFDSCSSLTNITIPNSVTSIRDYTFDSCSSLTNITIPNSVTYIGNGAFNFCKSLINIAIPKSVKEIGALAFKNCSSITSITIPDSVTYIGHFAFDSCTSLTNVTISDSVTSIRHDTFASCTSLTSITIPDSVTYIGSNAFDSCTGLTSIAIPSSITEIGYYAFENCGNLKKVYYGGSKKDWSAVSISPYNAPLWSATILYNQTEPWR